MALHKLERRNYGGKWPMSIKYQNLHSFKERLILLCQRILETRRITDLHGSAHFTIPLRCMFFLSFISSFFYYGICFYNFPWFHISLIWIFISKIGYFNWSAKLVSFRLVSTMGSATLFTVNFLSFFEWCWFKYRHILDSYPPCFKF